MKTCTKRFKGLSLTPHSTATSTMQTRRHADFAGEEMPEGTSAKRKNS
jgi:hypothetical protein